MLHPPASRCSPVHPFVWLVWLLLWIHILSGRRLRALRELSPTLRSTRSACRLQGTLQRAGSTQRQTQARGIPGDRFGIWHLQAASLCAQFRSR